MTDIIKVLETLGALGLLTLVLFWIKNEFLTEFKDFKKGVQESTEKKLTGFEDLKKSVDDSTMETVKAIRENGLCVKETFEKICKFVLMVVPQSPETQKLAEGLLTGDTKEKSKPGKAA